MVLEIDVCIAADDYKQPSRLQFAVNLTCSVKQKCLTLAINLYFLNYIIEKQEMYPEKDNI